MTVLEAVYDADFTTLVTDHGTLIIKHEITIGDMLVTTSIAVLIIISVIKFMIDKFWR